MSRGEPEHRGRISISVPHIRNAASCAAFLWRPHGDGGDAQILRFERRLSVLPKRAPRSDRQIKA